MKKIVLINPDFVEKDRRNKGLYLQVQSYPPLSLAYLCASLKQEHDAVILDAPAEGLSLDQIIHRLKQEKPDFVGIYVSSFMLNKVFRLIAEIRKALETVIVVGGPHLIYIPNSLKLLGADYGFVGEAEVSFTTFVNDYEDTEKALATPGLIYYDAQGRIRINPAEPIENLDALPFPSREDLPHSKYFTPLYRGKKITTLITSRGCVYDCIFCALPSKKTYRFRSPENVVAELQQLEAEGYDYVEVQDDFLTCHMDRIEALCRLMIHKGMTLKWGCETRADFTTPRLLRQMKQAGCVNIKFGAESGSDRVRNQIIRKYLDATRLKAAVKNARKVGMDTICYFMFGHPTEQYAEMEETVRLAFQVDPDYAEFHIAIPIPGSRLFDQALHEGRIDAQFWDRALLGEQIGYYIPQGITLDQMQALQRKAYARFYFRPQRIAREILRVRGGKDLLIKARSAWVILQDKLFTGS